MKVNNSYMPPAKLSVTFWQSQFPMFLVLSIPRLWSANALITRRRRKMYSEITAYIQ